MKEKFKACMRYLFPGPVPPQQIADMARVFCMGWVESINTMGLTPGVDFEVNFAIMTDPKWVPDDSWVWWK